jgi:PRTRC genetic system protein B
MYIYPFRHYLYIRHNQDTNANYYIESYDMDDQGKPINAHPLSVQEADGLAKALTVSSKQEPVFLQAKGLLSENVLFIQSMETGYAIWYTPAQKRNLLFSDNLGIPSGEASVPALVWKASKSTLSIYALCDNQRPLADTSLYYAPFFNVYQDGSVCMGTVDVAIKKSTSLEAFMLEWENYFFNSYFSHLNGGHCPVSGNIIQLWQSLLTSQQEFPSQLLLPAGKTLNVLIK